ncbi:CopG family transcriptional regulator [Brevundimonas sp.]|uniref:ribbon-helix-helix domain-containing protein n=1 Tax=Brevundimonas sp. TaxID=1871086 RepID=UPI002731D741|nr:CopG family transcriptional regulator [Brevundimonas sp.]MDP1912221.1 CopG family transcriptional regulator [Brevundimonas sp.]
MTLTVRLQPELASALELHCAERGVTKSLVVQEVLAEYLAQPPRRGSRGAAAPAPAEPSANYRAFEALGLIGCVEGVGPADKAGVRAAFERRHAAKREARPRADQTAARPRAEAKPRTAR